MPDRFPKFASAYLSPQGWGRVILWTVLGTIGCIGVAFFVDSLSTAELSASERLRSQLNSILIPLLLAPGLLCFFSSKLRELAIAHAGLQRMAATDSLTRVLNRGAFTMLVEAYLEDVRSNDGGAMLIIDADHFKGINDRYGHQAGDQALRLIADCIKQATRKVDLVGRIGGEEFGVLLSGANYSQACDVADRICQSISAAGFQPRGTPASLSVSIGGVAFQDQSSFHTLFQIADEQLYAAKSAGRDQTMLVNAA